MKKSFTLLMMLIIGTIWSAFARGGCFLSWTQVQTPTWIRFIQELIKWDIITTYNFNTNQQETGIIWWMMILTREWHYVLNNSIHVTAEHPFYIMSWWQAVIKTVAELQTGDHLIWSTGEIILESKSYITWSVQVYNLLDVTSNHNYYVNEVLVHNKGWWGWGGGWWWWSSHHSSYKNSPCRVVSSSIYNTQSCVEQRANDDRKVIWVLLFGTVGLAIAFFLEKLLKKISKALWISYTINFLNTTKFDLSIKWIWVMLWLITNFTQDQTLIFYTKEFNNWFINKYSRKYLPDDQDRNQMKLHDELSEQEYINYISKTNLLDTCKKIFLDYQFDWTKKDREHMSQYSGEEFIKEQQKIFTDSFGDGRDITNNTSIDGLVLREIVVDKRRKPDDGEIVIRVQINASMINFAINTSGKVITWTDQMQSFTEYWDFRIDSNKTVTLQNIRQHP